MSDAVTVPGMSVLSIDDVETVTVLGAGSMGHGIAEVIALAGYDVHLRDIEKEYVQKGYDQIAWSIGKLVDGDSLTDEEGDATLNRIKTYVSLPDALTGVDVVVEVVPEKMALKKQVYDEVEEHAPEDAIFMTNTSTLSITELSEATDRPKRFCGTHFFNPPVRMPLVEVIRGDHTGEETLDFAEAFVESIDKTPIRVRKDAPGFIVNRVLVPLLNEAAWIVHEDDATIAEVDSTAIEQLGLPMGCFELSDQIGIDVAVDVLDYMHETLGEEYAPCPLLKEKVDAGVFGKKTGQGFYDWEDGSANIPSDGGREDVATRLVGIGINEVSKLVAQDVAAPNEINEALKLGASFPEGPTVMAASLGYDEIHKTLATIYVESRAGRYEPTSLLAEWAETGGPTGGD
jgi:enoyl-CoA hydratase/3-hydroxyacyl-CoA dehydrogenase